MRARRRSIFTQRATQFFSDLPDCHSAYLTGVQSRGRFCGVVGLWLAGVCGCVSRGPRNSRIASCVAGGDGLTSSQILFSSSATMPRWSAAPSRYAAQPMAPAPTRNLMAKGSSNPGRKKFAANLMELRKVSTKFLKKSEKKSNRGRSTQFRARFRI